MGEPPSPVIESEDAGMPLDAAFLRTLLEALPTFVVRVDRDHRIRYINHMQAGYTLDQVIGRPVQEFLIPEHVAQYEHAVTEALRTGRMVPYMVQGAATELNGGRFVYESYAVPVDDSTGERGICIVATDVTERVTRAQALQESEEKLRLAVEATGLGLWRWDVLRDQVDWNDRIIEMLGEAPRSVREYLDRFVHPDDRGRILGEVDDAKAGRPQFVEHRVIRTDGQVRWLMPSGRVISDAAGKVVRLIGGTLDVTAQRRTDEHLRDMQKLDAIGSLTAGVAHNFNNMLAVILPNIELALRTASLEQMPMLDDALHAARRATELVAQLMKFSGQGRVGPREEHDLRTLVERAVSMCEHTFERHVDIAIELDPRCGAVQCEPAAIEQVVVNLLINARDAVLDAKRGDPRISVQLSETPPPAILARDATGVRYARIRVEDNGVGMGDEVKRRLFEPFFTTKAVGKGSGLGLSTSYGIVRDHSGLISFDSQPHGGTTFDVWLPLAADPAEKRAHDEGVARAFSPGRVLVVDDEPALRRLVSVILTKRGHEVVVASDGARAVALLDAGIRPHVILLDHSMPGWNASRTIDEIRQREATVPIVFFSGEDVPSEDRERAQGVLHKPLSGELLLREIERFTNTDAARVLPETSSLHETT